MTTYRLFPATNGPASGLLGGAFAAGVAFEVTSGGTWFEGYWWWVCESGSDTRPQTFALWQAYGEGNAILVSAATVYLRHPHRRAVELHSPRSAHHAQHRRRR